MALKNSFAALVSREARIKRAISRIEVSESAAKSFAELARFARDGDVESQYRVGKAYLEGWGTPPSLEAGTLWTRKAAISGHVQARLVLATLYLNGFPDDFDENRTEILKSDAPGKLVPDLEQAAYWSRLAADAGQPDAQALLGYILSTGPESLRDVSQARELYERSAAAGSPQGHLGLGMALHAQPQSDADRQRGTAELSLAAEAGLASAHYFLAWINEQGIAQERDFKAAAYHFRKAAERGVGPAQTRLALYLLQGKGVKRQVDRAETWLRRAALGGGRRSCGFAGRSLRSWRTYGPGLSSGRDVVSVGRGIGAWSSCPRLSLALLDGYGGHPRC